MLRVIGLTGSIACGKSTVSEWLQTQPDCRVIDGDQLSRELCKNGGAALPLIRKQFGSQFFTADGSLNRQRLGEFIFAHPDAREALDRLMAPLLEDLTAVRLEQARADGITLCFLDFPLLFEKGYDSLCDTVWCVYLPLPLQLSRLMRRDHLTEEAALQRINAVLSSEEKASRSQVVIDNSGDLSFTLSLLPALLETERRQSVSGRRRRTAKYQTDSGLEPGSSSEGISPENEYNSGRSVLASWQHESASSFPISWHEDPSSPPPVMERPHSSGRKTQSRKASWKMPPWLVAVLSVTFLITAISFSAQVAMRAWLTRQEEKHLMETNAIYANYPMEYRSMIEDAADTFNLNPAFVSAIVRNESSFQPRAVSSVGARGLMQLMPDTAEWIAGKMKISGYAFERMFDPESNLQFGCWYLRYLSSLFHGDPVCVACAYHAGQGQVTAWLSDPLLSSDGINLELEKMTDGPTKTYAGRVIQAYGIYQTLYFNSALSDDGNMSAEFGSTGR